VMCLHIALVPGGQGLNNYKNRVDVAVRNPSIVKMSADWCRPSCCCSCCCYYHYYHY